MNHNKIKDIKIKKSTKLHNKIKVYEESHEIQLEVFYI